jgi:hypothetical protein
MIDTIRQTWGWTGLEPTEVLDINAFGNLLVRAVDGTFWRICPEELSCEKIARDTDGFAALSGQEDFQVDWQMTWLVELAERKLGPLPKGRCYCLKVPALLGGKYDDSNFGTNSLKELIAFSGDLAEQIRDVPDGGQIKIDIVN